MDLKSGWKCNGKLLEDMSMMELRKLSDHQLLNICTNISDTYAEGVYVEKLDRRGLLDYIQVWQSQLMEKLKHSDRSAMTKQQTDAQTSATMEALSEAVRKGELDAYLQKLGAAVMLRRRETAAGPIRVPLPNAELTCTTKSDCTANRHYTDCSVMMSSFNVRCDKEDNCPSMFHSVYCKKNVNEVLSSGKQATPTIGQIAQSLAIAQEADADTVMKPPKPLKSLKKRPRVATGPPVNTAIAPPFPPNYVRVGPAGKRATVCEHCNITFDSKSDCAAHITKGHGANTSGHYISPSHCVLSLPPGDPNIGGLGAFNYAGKNYLKSDVKGRTIRIPHGEQHEGSRVALMGFGRAVKVTWIDPPPAGSKSAQAIASGKISFLPNSILKELLGP